MVRFRVATTGYISGMGLDHIKQKIPHRFEGGNAMAEIYPTEDGNEIAILSKDRHCTMLPVEPEVPADENPQEAVREEAETPAVQEEAEKAPVTYSREEVAGFFAKKNYKDELVELAGDYGVGMRKPDGSPKKKTTVVQEITDEYMVRQEARDK